MTRSSAIQAIRDRVAATGTTDAEVFRLFLEHNIGRSALIQAIDDGKAYHAAQLRAYAPGNEFGTVKWWNDSKGYGFIEADAGDELFAHYTAICGDGFKTLAEGQRVQFARLDGPKGPQADRIDKVTQ